MGRYEFIEHTADVGFTACGHNLAEAFSNAACAMFSIITDLSKVGDKESRIIEIEESDIEVLLVEWLNSLIYYFDTEGIIFTKFDITHLDENTLKAKCLGEKYDPARHELNLGVKSATYHMLRVDREKNEVRVILDV